MLASHAMIMPARLTQGSRARETREQAIDHQADREMNEKD
jgi:hypothetical protein